MAKRTIRNKIRWQAKKAIDDVDSILDHFRYLDELSDSRSDYINQNLPGIVLVTTELKKAIERFRDGL